MSKNTTGTKIGRYAVTIPSSASPASVYSLLVAAGMPTGFNPSNILGLKIDPWQPASNTPRGAFIIGNPRLTAGLAHVPFAATDITTHGQYVDAGVVYDEPADADVESYICSSDTNPVSALAIVYLV